MKIIYKELIKLRFGIVVLAFIGGSCLAGYKVYVHDDISIYLENGVLENSQVVVLMVVCLVFVFHFFQRKKDGDKLFFLFFAFLSLSFILRELNLERLSLPYIVQLAGAGMGRDIIVSVGFIAIFMYAFFHFSHYKNAIYHFASSREALGIFIAGAVLHLSIFFEKAEFIKHHVFLEEISELLGYVLMLLVAFSFPTGEENSKDGVSCIVTSDFSKQ